MAKKSDQKEATKRTSRTAPKNESKMRMKTARNPAKADTTGQEDIPIITDKNAPELHALTVQALKEIRAGKTRRLA